MKKFESLYKWPVDGSEIWDGLGLLPLFQDFRRCRPKVVLGCWGEVISGKICVFVFVYPIRARIESDSPWLVRISRYLDRAEVGSARRDADMAFPGSDHSSMCST